MKKAATRMGASLCDRTLYLSYLQTNTYAIGSRPFFLPSVAKYVCAAVVVLIREY